MSPTSPPWKDANFSGPAARSPVPPRFGGLPPSLRANAPPVRPIAGCASSTSTARRSGEGGARGGHELRVPVSVRAATRCLPAPPAEAGRGALCAAGTAREPTTGRGRRGRSRRLLGLCAQAAYPDPGSVVHPLPAPPLGDLGRRRDPLRRPQRLRSDRGASSSRVRRHRGDRAFEHDRASDELHAVRHDRGAEQFDAFFAKCEMKLALDLSRAGADTTSTARPSCAEARPVLPQQRSSAEVPGPGESPGIPERRPHLSEVETPVRRDQERGTRSPFQRHESAARREGRRGAEARPTPRARAQAPPPVRAACQTPRSARRPARAARRRRSSQAAKP